MDPNVQAAQDEFVQKLSKATGILPTVIQGWVAKEGAYAPNGTGGYNFLNLRPYAGSDVGVAGKSPGGFDQFGNLDSAIQSTVARVKQPFLQKYLAPVINQGPDAQWNAITQSGWDAGHYGHTPLGAPAGPAGPVAPAAASSPVDNAAAGRHELLSFLSTSLLQHQHMAPSTLLPELQKVQAIKQGQQPAAASSSPLGGITGKVAGDVGSAAARIALTQLGTPYQWGGAAKLGAHTDCSGLVQAAFRAVGVNLPRTTYQQWTQGTPVDVGHLAPGDAVFFHMSQRGPEHVGIYLGNDHFVEDPHTGADVRVETLSTYGGFVGARRFA